MKKISRFILFGVLLAAFFGCGPSSVDPIVINSDDDALPGEQVAPEEEIKSYYKLFVLNEGTMGMNQASLDFFRYPSGKYIRDAFSQMNPTAVGGLGDIGNDLKVFLNSLWIVVNGSNLVEVVSALDEKHIATISIPSPREITFDSTRGYAYVTSYAGAYYGGEDRLGAVYRISLTDLEVKDQVTVGYQPEGITLCGGLLFVANSGGFHEGFDNRVTVIDPDTFEVIRHIEVAPNLKSICSDGIQHIWVQSQGNWADVPSGLYQLTTESTKPLDRTDELKDVRVSCMYYDPYGRYVYVIGSQDEFDWTKADKQWTISSVHVGGNQKVNSHAFSGDLLSIKNPYGLAVDSFQGIIFISDYGDGKNPGKVYAFDSTWKMKWNKAATAGMFPGHLCLYYPYSSN